VEEAWLNLYFGFCNSENHHIVKSEIFYGWKL